MDTALIRLLAQVLLVSWSAGEIMLLVLAKGQFTKVVGTRWAIAGLLSFAAWMFLSALTIKSIELFPRDSVLWVFAFLELNTAGMAWAWLITNVCSSFEYKFRKNHNQVDGVL